MKLKNKNILVYGMSISGEWAAKLLLKLKASVYLYDDDIEKVKSKGLKNCFIVNSLNESLVAEFDAIIVSPSIEKENSVILWAKKHAVKVYSEVEFAGLFCKKMVAVTGTNGKTTTVELITAILKQKYRAVACGNIGYPLSRAVIEHKNSIKVVEVSSFMLENCQTFSPHVATVLNVQADHLVRHKTMQEYKTLKLSLLKNLKQTDYVVVNLDNDIHTNTNALTITYSYSHMADVRVRDGAIFLHNEKVVDLNELKLKGKHNIYNVMSAICYAYIYKIKLDDIRKTIMSFKPDRFRIEKVKRVNEIQFVNDSKSTNIASTLACVNTIKGAIILLLGGSKKGLNYKELFAGLSKRVAKVIVYGEIALDLIAANDDKFEIFRAKNLNLAFDKATSLAKKNDTILLSPATASYDEFANYIERGEFFNEKVKQYELSAQKK